MPRTSSPPRAFAAQMERRVRRIVWCTMATTGADGRPRTRIVHPWCAPGDDPAAGGVWRRPAG